MADSRFDSLSKALAVQRSRRGALKVAGMALLAVAFGRRSEPADAASACPPAETLCPNSGCVNLLTNPLSCGACGHICTGSLGPFFNTCCNGVCCPMGSVCSGGVCQSFCNGGFTNTQTDPKNCGSCGHVCPTPTGGTATCSSGVCGAACPSGATLCGTAPSQVCCSVGQCCGAGVCVVSGNACPGSNQVCSSGACVACGSPTQVCCADSICNTGGTCLNGTCCPSAQVCISVCCPDGWTCTSCAVGGPCLGGACCPNAQVCSGGCCPSGQICVSGACCPIGRACRGGICCPSGQSCINGGCFKSCSTGADCPGCTGLCRGTPSTGNFCAGSTSGAICEVSSDCSAGLICGDGECFFPCLPA